MESIPELIEKGLARLIVKDPFWGRVAQEIVWKKGGEFAMGVALSRNGFKGYYNMDIIKQLGVDTPVMIAEIIKHELWHIVLRHPFRVYSQLPHLTNNIAMDMVVNGTKHNPRVNLPDKFVWCPPEWEEYTFDEIIHKMIEPCKTCPVFKQMMQQMQGGGQENQQGGGQGNQQNQQGGGQGNNQDDGQENQQSDGQGNQQNQQGNQQDDGQGNQQSGGQGNQQDDGQENQSCPFSQGNGQGNQSQGNQGQGNDQENLKHNCGMKPCPLKQQLVNDHRFMIDNNDLDESQYNQMLKTKLEQARKDAGGAPGEIETIIEELGKAIINWKKLLHMYQGRHMGGKRPTLKRPNRRIRKFGIKGSSKKSRASMSVFVDESLSISNEENKQFFAEIDKMSSYYKITLITWSVGITDVIQYHRGMWKKVVNKGRGGTDLDVTLNQAEENGLIGQCNIVLTDGEFYSEVKERNYPIIFVITTNAPPPQWADMVIRLEV